MTAWKFITGVNINAPATTTKDESGILQQSIEWRKISTLLTWFGDLTDPMSAISAGAHVNFVSKLVIDNTRK